MKNSGFKFITLLCLVLSLSACASKKKKPDHAKPSYASAEALFKAKSAICQDDVEHFTGNKPMTLTPEAQMLNEETAMFCIQKLKTGNKILKVTTEIDAATPDETATEEKRLTTGFDLVKYDKTLTKLQALKPVIKKHEGNQLYTYYDFKKLKSLPAYFVVLFQRESTEKPIYTADPTPSKEAVSDHSAVSGAAGVAMGGFATAAGNMSMTKTPPKLMVYPKKAVSVKVEWVSRVGK